MALSDLIIGAESGGQANARNPRSSAYGAGQFIESTWLDTLRRHRPDLASLPRDQQLALRGDPALSKQMTDAYAQDNAGHLKTAGFDPTPGNAYLAHFAGPTGAVKVLQANPTTPVMDILGGAATQANPFLKNMTAGDLRSWADRKMGAPIPPMPIPMPQQAAPNLPLFPPNAMASAAPQQAAPPGQPQPAGQPASPSIFDFLSAFQRAPNLPLFGQPDRQQTYGG